MMPALIAAGAVVLLAVGLIVVVRRRSAPSRLEGVDRFRRHMDALSSEARRDVIDRVREARRDSEEQ